MNRFLGPLIAFALVWPATPAHAEAPSNDAFENATTIGSIPYEITESNVDATTQPGEPMDDCFPVAHTIWFRFTAATRGMKLVASAAGSDFNVVGGVYAGTALDNLETLGCFDDIISSTAPQVAFSTAANTTYYVQIGSDYLGSEGGLVHFRLDPAATITGSVRNHNGRPLPGACVAAVDPTHSIASSTISGRHGNYLLRDLPGGEYRVKFEDCGQQVDAPEWYDDAPTFVAASVIGVQPGSTTNGVDATLSKGGSIEGVLTVSPSGNPAADACVRVYDQDQEVVGITNAASDGRYSISPLLGGSTYKVEFNGEGCSPAYFPAWYADKQDFASADPVAVSVGNSTIVDATLQTTLGSGSISGTVKSATGAPLQTICVYVVVPDNGVLAQGALTEADGTYIISGLGAGTFKITFIDCSEAQAHGREWYHEKGDLASADPLTLADGAQISGIDEVMDTPPG